MSAECAFIDPHMHLWDFQEHADVHDRSLLAGLREQALLPHYAQEIEVSAALNSASINAHHLAAIISLASQAHRPVQQIVVVEALPLLPLEEISAFSSDAKVAAFVAAIDLRKDTSMLSEMCSRSSKARCHNIGGLEGGCHSLA